MTTLVLWISVGVIVFALAVLVVVSLGTSARVPALRAAAEDLKRRQSEAQPLREAVAGMQHDVAHVQERVAETRERIAAIKAARQAQEITRGGSGSGVV
jgi:heme exporter protein D